jgi:hypothetical protein
MSRRHSDKGMITRTLVVNPKTLTVRESPPNDVLAEEEILLQCEERWSVVGESPQLINQNVEFVKAAKQAGFSNEWIKSVVMPKDKGAK